MKLRNNPYVDQAIYAGISGFFTVLGLIPRPVARRMGNALGRIWFAADGRHRRIAVANLTQAFGREKTQRGIRGLARSNFMQMGQVLFEIAWYLRQDLDVQRKYLRFDGISRIKRARDQRKGVLYMTAHMGNWEILASAAALLGCALGVVYRPLDLAPLNRFILESRTRFGSTMIPTARSMRKILTTVQQGGEVVMLMDQNFDCHEGVFADFFGKPACTNKGLALLARKTGAPVVPAFMVREGSGFTLKIGPEIPFVRTGDKTKDLEINTLRYNRAIEAIIRQYPDQWFWVHQRWKTRTCHPWPRES